jgi:hypothetical protein
MNARFQRDGSEREREESETFTLADLVRAVSQVTADEKEIVAVVADLIDAGRIQLRGRR